MAKYADHTPAIDPKSVAELQRVAAQICQGREDSLAGVAYSLCSMIHMQRKDITK